MSGNNKNKWTTLDGTDYLDLITPTKPEPASSANNFTTTPNGTVDLLFSDDDNDANAYSKDCQNMKRGITTAKLGNRDNEKLPRVSTSPLKANNTPPTAKTKTDVPPTVQSDVAIANEDDFEEGRDKELELRALEQQRGHGQVGVGGLKNDADYENNKEGEGKVAAAGIVAAESREVSFLEVSQQYLSIPISHNLFSLS
jgi:hypothetical protein